MPEGATKRIVCLANSRKMAGRCVAGKEFGVDGAWIRPVSDRESEEVSAYERQYESGGDPQLLDVIDIPLLAPKPQNHQKENWLLDPDCYWEKVRRVTWEELAQLADPESPLWVTGDSTSNGCNDRMSAMLAHTLDSSLRLIRIDALELVVSQPSIAYGNYKRSVQGRFSYCDEDYWLRVTDPVCERQYLQYPDGSHTIGECYLTVSIGEDYRGYCYKLIAGVMNRP